jgi:hypothetical protein
MNFGELEVASALRKKDRVHTESAENTIMKRQETPHKGLNEQKTNNLHLIIHQRKRLENTIN